MRVERLRFADDQPLALDSVWLPADIGRHLLAVDLTAPPSTKQLRERAGITITEATRSRRGLRHRTETLEPIVPDDDARTVLRLDDDEALLRVRRLGRSHDRPVECRLTLLRGQHFLYTSSWSVASRGAYDAD